MKWLLTLTFFCMALAHVVRFGLPRYFPLVGVLGLVLFLGKKVYLPLGRWWYSVGCLLFLGASGAASIRYGNTLSYAYFGMGIVNYFLYPLYERARLTNLHLGVVTSLLLVSCIPLGFGDTLKSVYDNPNNYSAVVFSTMYLGLLLLRGRLLWQLLLYALILTLIFLGASRSMLGASLIFGLLYFGQAYVLRRTLRLLLVGGFVISAVAYYSLITNDQFRLMETIQANTVGRKSDRGLSHRDELFFQSFELLKDRSTGYGLGMANQALEKKFGQHISPHNAYLKITVEGGWVALLGFLVLIVGFWLTSQSPLASSFLFALMIRSFFESATPLSLSLISGMFIIPMFLNETSVEKGYRLRLTPPSLASPVKP